VCVFVCVSVFKDVGFEILVSQSYSKNLGLVSVCMYV